MSGSVAPLTAGVNGIENTAYWKPVPQPTYLTIANGNLTGFNGTKTLGEQSECGRWMG